MSEAPTLSDPRRGATQSEGAATYEHVVLRSEGVSKFFPVKAQAGRAKGLVRAVDSVTLSVGSQRTLGLVGESGSGKTTFGWTVARLYEPTVGRIEFEGRDISHLEARALRGVHRHMQMIFQNPWTSLDPQFSIGQTLVEPLHIHGVGTRRDRDVRVDQLLELVGLHPSDRHRYPHELSGGQRQRVGIARPLPSNPRSWSRTSRPRLSM